MTNSRRPLVGNSLADSGSGDSDLDAVATTKANLELLLLENRNLLDQFGELMTQLEEIGSLPPAEKRERLDGLESSGAFGFNGIDIRRFQAAAGKPLAPPQFLVRTRRRMDNTLSLLKELAERKAFDEADALQAKLSSIQAESISPDDADAVRAYRDKVEVLRNSQPFLNYMDVKSAFLREDPEFKTEAEFVATKEAVADGEQAARSRQDELEEIQQKMDDGDLSAEAAQEAIDALNPAGAEAD